MASQWPAVGASLRRRSLQNQEQLEESEALKPVAGHPATSSGALGPLCRQFQRRLPLRAVSRNLGRIQESCQSGTQWLVETQVKARRWKRGRSTWLSVASLAHSSLDPWEKEYHRLSAQMGPRAHPWRQSRREASDSDLESVGAGIRHLQKVSQELDEAIVAED
ncbi:hypothetical protein FD755_015610, partial [Muntiacus reevesi]